MSANLRIHKVYPTNKKVSYGELENIDFNLSFPNRKLKCNSIRIEGRLEVYSNSTNRMVLDNEIYIDNFIGANAFFESYQTSAEGRGILESLSNAPRYHKMISTGSNTEIDNFNISNVCELKTGNLRLSKDVICGSFNADMGQNPTALNMPEGSSFSVRPSIILNQVSRGQAGGNTDLSNSTMGDIRISVRTSSSQQALFGPDATATSTYILKDVALTFHSVPDDGNQNKLVMRTKQVVRQSIQSGLGVISCNVPQLTNGCSISFIKSSEQNQNLFNNVRLDRLNNVSQVEFLINDSQSEFLTFQLKTQNEIMKFYLDSISNSNLNHFDLSVVDANEAYGIGCPFSDLIDLSSDTFSVNINSSIVEPFTCFLFFSGLVFV